MKEFELKYGCNPNQQNAKIYNKDNLDLPIKVLNGKPGYINFLDALNSWQLVSELKEISNYPAAASFKHVSPAGASIGTKLSETLKKVCRVDDLELSPLASAYAKARGADRMSSYGDFAALSHECDEQTALLLKREVSDGVIAPSYSKEALEILKTKKKGNYNILSIDPNYTPYPIEKKEVFGITFEQKRNDIKIDKSILNNIVTNNKNLTQDAITDLLIGTITLKYTQSNSVCYVKDGMAVGIGAGQQSRIHCTRLAGDKADVFFLRSHEKVLNLPFLDGIPRATVDNTIDIYISKFSNDVLDDGKWQELFKYRPEPLSEAEKTDWLKKVKDVSLCSDAFFPFGDNIERANRSGVKYVAESGGSIRDDNVIKTANDFDMVMAFTGIRLFHH